MVKEISDKIKLVVFDLWETLAYRNLYYHTTTEILRLFHPHLSKKKLIKIFEISLQTKKWKSEKKAFGNLIKNLGLSGGKEMIKLLMALRDYADSRTKLYPHTLEMLKTLKRKGYKIGLLSNSSVFDVHYIRDTTSLLNHIDFSLFSFEINTIKPDKKMFRTMLSLANVSPNEAIMIGDKIGDDIAPAKKIGMKAIHFKNYLQLKKDLEKFGIVL